MIEITNTHVFAELVTERLALLIATQRYGRKPWRKKRVAEYITGSEEIKGSVSATTIGRLLTPDYPQQPSDETLVAVAQFLIIMGALSERQLELLAEAPVFQPLGALESLFGMKDAEGQRDFLRELAGRYRCLRAANDQLLTLDLLVSFVPEAKALSVIEAQVLYSMPDPSDLRARTGGFDPNMVAVVERDIARKVLAERGTLITAGTALASPDILAFLHTSGRGGYPSIFSAETLIYGEAGAVMQMSGRRNCGWSGEESFPKKIDGSLPAYEVIKALARDLEYHRPLVRKELEIQPPVSKPSEEDRDFAPAARTSGEALGKAAFEIAAAQASSLDARLSLALEWGELAAFEDALNQGANPNLLPAGETDPLIFQLADHGRRGWIDALIASGRCDLTVVDRQGLRPSHTPGVYARRIATSGLAPDLARQFAALSSQLLDETIRQLGGDPATLERDDTENLI